MINTIIQIFVFQILFLAVYDLFLKGETFFNLNRIYLLLTSVLSFILPFITIAYIQQNIPQEYVLQLPTVLIAGNTSESLASGNSNSLSIILGVWLVGCLFSGLLFLWKVYKISKLKSAASYENHRGFKLVILPKTDSAFSYFNTIFLGANISDENKASIIAHEKIHIEQKHSFDLMFFEFLRIISWFNPMVYLFQNRMATLHEFIADAEVTNRKGKKQYYQNLLSEVFQTEKISFINTFFNQSLIKKRIIMLQKSKSRKIARLKYLLLLPIVGLMLVYSSCSEEMTSKDNGISTQDRTVNDIEAGRETSDISFAEIEKVPTYPGCSGDNETMKKCMSMSISKFINENFNTKIVDDLNISGMQRISTKFKIDKTGRVVDVIARSLTDTPELEAEAIRVLKLLPQMEPGEQKGKKVGVLYSLPIVFEVVE